MKARHLCVILSLVYGVFVFPFAAHMKSRPVVEKLGYIPEAEMLKVLVGDQRYTISEFVVLKVMFYFGSLLEKSPNKFVTPPDYSSMSRLLTAAAKLDPYNMDAYYFAQAAFTWEVKGARDVNKFLTYGMKYRTWDWYLPFFVGFNSAYFLKDYKSAAHYMEKAAEISHNPLFTNLAARYYYEAGLTDLGVIFIDAMEKGAKDEKVKRLYGQRKEALLAVQEIRRAVDKYSHDNGRLPKDLAELVASGYLTKIPGDPYGGTFYLAPNGMVRSTSKFAFTGENDR